MVGDSLTHATVYPNRISELLDMPENPAWKMLGTNQFVPDEKFTNNQNHESGYICQKHRPNVFHEGWGGKTWKWHLENGTFCLPNKKIDLPLYFKKYCNGNRPNIVVFMLGINDCFYANTDNPEPDIDRCLGYADKLISEFKKELPAAKIGVCLIAGPNQFETAFEHSYSGKYHRWGWKRIQHALNRKMILHYEASKDENIFLIATNLVIDPILGYPDDNGVHPNSHGYTQLATTYPKNLKSMMMQPNCTIDRKLRK